MRLRNKKTGEIIELLAKPSFVKRNDDYLQSEINTFNSLAELNEEWEDYEEPKEYWHIFGTNITKTQEGFDELYDKRNKELGNHFETKEEAEKAVEKLKAWKRLKEKIIDHILKYEFDDLTEDIHANISFSVESYPNVGNDLDLLFCTEENG